MSDLTRRQVLKALAAVGTAGATAPLLSACSDGIGQQTAPDLAPVKIGLLVPQSGANKTIGDDLSNGFQLYLKLHDNRLGGRQVNLVTVDEGETAESGKAGAERLLRQEKVLAFSGVASSATMIAIRDLVETSQTPLVGSNASPTTLQGVRYIWRTSYVDDEPGKAMGRFVASRLRAGSVAIIATDDQSGRDEVRGFMDTFTGNIEGEPVFTPAGAGQAELAPFLSTIRSSGARAVFCFYGGTQAIDFVKQYRRAGLTQELFAPGFLTEGQVLREQGEAARGIFTALNYSPDLDNQPNRQFAAAYREAHGMVPTTYAMASYDAALVLDRAIEGAGAEVTPQTVNLAMGKIGSIDSPRGSWQFNQNRTPLQKWYLRQVRPDGAVLSNTVLSELITLG